MLPRLDSSAELHASFFASASIATSMHFIVRFGPDRRS
ncbi:Protein of unknown function [Propionibacterium freudenreichii]|nr:Protein of unknown function [Propionibacterium freudenreichii]